MQRLISSFPTGSAGLGLLIMRVAMGVSFLQGAAGAQGAPGPGWMVALSGLLAVGLVIGLLTPVASVLSILLVLYGALVEAHGMHMFPGCVVIPSVALALLGPGAYSLDARLFGRRRIVLSRARDTED